MVNEIAEIIKIAIRERTWRLEEAGCGGDEINVSVDKLIEEIKGVAKK